MTLPATDDLLVRYHSALPEATPLAFETVRTSDGRNSYDLCVDAAGPWLPADRVLDLGCGGGTLLARLDARQRLGVDLTPAQIERARTRLGPSAQLVAGPAHHLPLADASVDLAVSHMSLMLMRPLDDVVAAVARVLKPGAGFVVVVGGRRPAHPSTTAMLQALWPALDGLGHTFVSGELGDRRCRTDDGLCDVLGPHFDLDSVEEHALFATETPEQQWDRLAGMYNLWELSANDLACVRDAVLPVLHREAVDGRVQVGQTVRVVVARRRR